MKTGFYIVLIAFLYSAVTLPSAALGATETLLPGSYIVNTGIVPQTNNNGLKPFGLIHDLITNYQVPVKWSIEPTKGKDGIDFIYNGVNYRGGPFVIPAEYIDANVASRILYWQGQGVSGIYTTASITIPVHATITSFPVIMIDTISGLQSIIINYYTLAGLDSTAYTLGAPSGLNECFDIWTNPHGDPVWSTHGPLYNFVTQNKGWIWGQCHAVSMMEDVVNPAPPYEQLNFLSQDGLKCWQSGSCGTTTEFHTLTPVSPFTNYYPADPEMQYMLDLYLATQSGSERWFHPLSSGGWRPETKVGVSTSTGTAPQQGVLAVYGPAFGDTANGRVMYVAGHSLTSGGGGVAHQHKVSAVRTYFNFLLLAGKARQLQTTVVLPSDTMNAATSEPVSVTVQSGTAPFTYEWTSSQGGFFEHPDSAATTYFNLVTTADTFDVVKVKVTDLCGRVNFVSKRIVIRGIGSSLPVSLLRFSADQVQEGVRLSWSTASETENDYFTLERATDVLMYLPLCRIDGAGNSTQTLDYAWTDTDPSPGLNYYRLSQTDYDGSSVTYPPVSLRYKDRTPWLEIHSIHPNPFSESFSMMYHSPDEEPALLEIKSSDGRVVYTDRLSPSKGSNVYNFRPEKNLARGIYLVTLSRVNSEKVTRMLMKK